jgi:choline dehydrogenase
METFDYVVVGAGSAGCVVARRLSDDPKVRVLLLEAGAQARGFWTRVPAGMGKMFSANPFNWGYTTEPVMGLNGRALFWPRGKTLGGSSAINGMVFTRGMRQDYDNWERAGNPGWSWHEVLPYFKALEDNQHGESDVRGAGGPLRISDPALRSPVIDQFIRAATQRGIPAVDDLSVRGVEGVGILQASIHGGLRQSTYDAYLAPVGRRANLVIRTVSHVTRVELTDRVATGVQVLEGGQLRIIRAAREVVLCAGALNSPQLLMNSGIGDGEQLQAHGIPTALHLPGVGKNLQDHLSVNVKVRTKRGVSHNRHLNGWRKYREGARYLASRSGYLACGATLAAAFTRSHAGVDYADLELGFRPISFSYAPSGEVTVDEFDAISVAVFACRPRSRGEVRLASADAMQPPVFIPNYLDDPADLRAMLSGIRQIRELLRSRPIADSIEAELQPGPNATGDETLTEFIRNTGKTSFHVSGTCRMGRDPLAVVDAQLRVHGIARLRVVDASIMPTVTSGNTNAPTIMIGEKGAALLKQLPSDS